MVTHDDVISAWETLKDANVGTGTSLYEFALDNDIERKCGPEDFGSCQDVITAVTDVAIDMGLLNPMAPSIMNESVGMAISIGIMLGILAARQEASRAIDLSAFEWTNNNDN